MKNFYKTEWVVVRGCCFYFSIFAIKIKNAGHKMEVKIKNILTTYYLLRTTYFTSMSMMMRMPASFKFFIPVIPQ
ncbi:MAG: hypothetical protein JWM56_651 [Candidatus Peribacteria bacterium]|nr:hypothetical protein [Candidatus Peribacteria bacterium]